MPTKYLLQGNWSVIFFFFGSSTTKKPSFTTNPVGKTKGFAFQKEKRKKGKKKENEKRFGMTKIYKNQKAEH